MSKKKKKDKIKKPHLVSWIDTETIINEDDAINTAANRVNNVIQKMTEAPETVLDHLKRVGVEPIIDEMSIDGAEPEPYILISFNELAQKEQQHMSAGGAFVDEYPITGTIPERKTVPTSPVVLEEIRRRIDEAMKRHPSSYHAQMSFDNQAGWPTVSQSTVVTEGNEDGE